MEKKTAEQRARLLLDSIIIEPKIAALLHQLKEYNERTFKHCLNVAFISIQIGYEWGVENDKLISLATGAVLHDIGKLDIPLSILDKEGPLTAEEFDLIRQHPQMGLDRVEGLGLDEVSKDIILHHHEHKDGTGYPDGTSLIRLNMETQIVGVADVWDAMTSERCYKHELSGDAALAELMDAKDRYYDHSAIRMLGLCNDK